MAETRKERNANKKNKKSKKKIWIIILIVILILALAAGGYALHLYNKLDDTVTEMYTPLDSDREKREEIDQRLDDKDTINVLMLGVDEREGDRGRSDTMIFASLNPDTNEMLMFSIPRDTYVNIPGRGEDKINHAYAFGGSELAVQTVENFLDTTIHFYSRVNMDGLEDDVDALGGVTVNNDREFSHNGNTFPVGEISLDGSEALSYSRERKQDPQGDLGRNDRQQKIIDSMVQEAMSFDSFTRIDSVLTAVGSNVETNMQMAEMRKMFMDYRGTRDETIREEINGSGQMMGGVWYYVVSDEEKSRVRTMVQEHMDKQ
ncbi:LCP family protein [Halalkalibacillus halophilus]|uniref:LCP family glycopolymer transferase n=1 Tax=Halalkalibacillus halophilus TaxID=392827 RepID=UPI000407D783|nr:LCP family protein [Halalkalibacillus halophilus]